MISDLLFWKKRRLFLQHLMPFKNKNFDENEVEMARTYTQTRILISRQNIHIYFLKRIWTTWKCSKETQLISISDTFIIVPTSSF